MGYEISKLSIKDIMSRCEQAVANPDLSEKPLVFSCANPHSLAIAEANSQFKSALSEASVLVTDGIGLSVAGSMFEVDVGPRITGGEFFGELMVQLNDKGQVTGNKSRVYFFGSSQKVLDLISKKVASCYPHIELCGMTSPPFGDWSEELDTEFVDQINAAKPDALWVGMTAPKQELWTHKNAHRLEVPVIGNIGAVFDFFAGTHERAPAWATKYGLEWLFRLCKEPRRMWKRNLISPALFMTSAYFHTRFSNDGRSDETDLGSHKH